MTSIFKNLIFLNGRICPAMVFSRYAWLARKQGLKRPYFILSMDCDTELDAEVAVQVHSKLRSLGIQPVYAVCGEILEAAADIYRQISDSGAEFINHGYRIHTRFNRADKTYEGVVFYERLSCEEVAYDIRRGHEAHLSILGKAPSGFRTPHFGTFQNARQLKLLHKTIKGLGYSYSTSTMPLQGLVHGPVRTSNYGIYELAVSGWYDKPDLILDSWSFRYDSNRKLKEDDYIKQFVKMMDFFCAGNHPALLNYYVDPSQVYDWEPFFECMKMAAPIAAASYKDILKEVLRCQ